MVAVVHVQLVAPTTSQYLTELYLDGEYYNVIVTMYYTPRRMAIAA